jgi:hypothetical protein
LAEEVAPISKSNLILPEPLERHVYEERDGDATPRNNTSLSLAFCFDGEDVGKHDTMLESSSDSEDQRAEVQTRTPKARSNKLQFDMFSHGAACTEDFGNSTVTSNFIDALVPSRSLSIPEQAFSSSDEKPLAAPIQRHVNENHQVDATAVSIDGDMSARHDSSVTHDFCFGGAACDEETPYDRISPGDAPDASTTIHQNKHMLTSQYNMCSDRAGISTLPRRSSSSLVEKSLTRSVEQFLVALNACLVPPILVEGLLCKCLDGEKIPITAESVVSLMNKLMVETACHWARCF